MVLFHWKHNKASIEKLFSQLKTRVNPKLKKLSSPGGPKARLNSLRKSVTALVKYERLEMNFPRADETRMYAERLISDAIRYGDCHRETMEMATHWLKEAPLVHKLFKVLVPRFAHSPVSYTKLYRAPAIYPITRPKAILELKGNPFPPLLQEYRNNKGLIHNVLLDEAKKAYRAKRYAEFSAKLDETPKETIET